MARVLISGLSPRAGGAAAMLRAVLGFLSERGDVATVAWYEPYSWTPNLSVPLFRLGTRVVSSEPRACPGARAGVAVGAWFPELEFTHYWPTRGWRDLIQAHDLHLAVAGSCLPALPFAKTGTRFLAWVASDWHGDRKDRVARFPPSRKLIDRLVTRPAVRRLEPRILRAGRILALSEPTRRALEAVARAPVVRAVLPFPVDLERFRPDASAVVPGRIGFVGRFGDPRKNIGLLLDAVAQARRGDPAVHAVIVGGEPSAEFLAGVRGRGLEGAIEFLPFLDPERLAPILRTFDLVAVTSHQEGLGIAFLEAMASGAPIVSTRCGGPEEYVEEGVNGFLVESRAEALAERFASAVSDRDARAQWSAGARRTVQSGYSPQRAREIFRQEIEAFESAAPAEAPGVRS